METADIRTGTNRVGRQRFPGGHFQFEAKAGPGYGSCTKTLRTVSSGACPKDTLALFSF